MMEVSGPVQSPAEHNGQILSLWFSYFLSPGIFQLCLITHGSPVCFLPWPALFGCFIWGIWISLTLAISLISFKACLLFFTGRLVCLAFGSHSV